MSPLWLFRSPVGYGGRPELYDLASDPGEEHNLYALRPALAAALARLLRARELGGTGRAPSGHAIDPDAAARSFCLSSPDSCGERP